MPSVGGLPSKAKLAVTAFCGGLLSGGIALAMTVWSLHGLFEFAPLDLRWVTLMAIGCLLSARDVWFPHVDLPHLHRQIPRETLMGNRTRGSYIFGLQMGFGFMTHLTSASPYALVCALLLLAPPITIAIAAGAGFAAGRAIPLLVRAIYRQRDVVDAWLSGSDNLLRILAATTTPVILLLACLTQ